ncbi:EAL domain-containing protein [Vibrio viridaestus]|uniref:EAL domain-containing protein n=2 Tax=Vibrio viridaestus TaxID=2487322 RepID=A0A3N9U618_9VIBR|nr:EAL domain-containing protein [Vibrio viridaestus]
MTHKSRLLNVFDACQEGFFHIDSKGSVTLYNQEFYKQFGINSQHIHLSEWYHRVHEEDADLVKLKIDIGLLEEGQRLSSHYRMLDTSGEYVWIERNAVCLLENGEKYIVGHHRDISDKKKIESFLNNTAFYDSFSGLFNLRKLFLDIDALKSQKETFNIVYIKIGNLQSMPDELSSGLVTDIVNNLKIATLSFADYSPTLYRINMSDYAVLMQRSDSIAPIVKACFETSSDYGELMYEQGHLLANKLSFGIYPDTGQELDSDEIVSLASRTCLYAAQSKSTHIEVYHGNTQSRIDRFFYIENELKNVLRDRKLSVKYHPIICAQTGNVQSFEALARWKSPSFGHIFPDEFIPVAEQKGLIVELGYIVFEKACHFIKQYNDSNGSNISININVSVLQLLNKNFPDNIRKMATQIGLSPANIVLEMTETFLLDENKNARDQLKLLKNMGFTLSLDDFGAGFSSVNSFFDFAFNQIKIDRTFAMKAIADEASSQYLEFLVGLCKSKNISVVIEGIEDSQMMNKFCDMGAGLLQGYWFAKPLSIASAFYYNPTETAKLLQENRK